MTSLLRDWLSECNIEWSSESKLEEEFANGFLIGKLLSNLEVGGLTEDVFTEEFTNDVSIEAMTENYKQIAKYLCEGGIDIKPKLLQDIANNVSGAIHRFIYDLKCVMSRRERDSLSQLDVNGNNNNCNTTSILSPCNAKVLDFGKSQPRITSPPRVRKPMFEDMQKRDVEQKIRALATEQFHLRSEAKWQKYRDFQAETEQRAQYEVEFEKQMQSERMAQRHDTLVKTLRTHHDDVDGVERKGRQKWTTNQRIMRKRVSDKAHFEDTQSAMGMDKMNKKRQSMAQDVEHCIDDFEQILTKTQKLEKSQNQESAASKSESPNPVESAKATKKKQKENQNDVNLKDLGNLKNLTIEMDEEDPLEHLENLRRKLPDKTVSSQKTEHYMAQIKVNVARQREEALQREQRRKKLIADEMARNQEQEHKDRQNEIEAIITETAPDTMAFDEKIKTIKLHKDIFTQNARLMKQKEKQREQRDKTIKLNRDRTHFEHKKVEFKTKLSIQTRKLQELQLKQAQHHHVENVKYCRALMGSIVDITYKSMLYRRLSDQATVPKQLRCEWLKMLSVQTSKHLALSTTQHVLSNVDGDKEAEDLPPAMVQKLAKEGQCHTDIEHIQNGLMQCLDITAPLNRRLINNTEFGDYLEGHGAWTYGKDQNEDTIHEPVNHELGSLVEEIIAVSEGPDPRFIKIIPDVPVTMAFMGKPFTGKSTQCQQIADQFALQIINPEEVIQSAISAFTAFNDQKDQNQESDAAESMEMTLQQQIGQRLQETLSDGKEVDDTLYIDVIFEAICSSQKDTKTNGWILDGFPIRRSQAELLESKLTGFVDTPPPKTGKPSKKKPSKIAPPKEQDPAEIPKIESGLDFVIYFDTKSDGDNGHRVLLERAKGRLVDEESGRVYHITSNPPPHDLSIKEGLKAPPDEEYVASLPEHFKAFDERKESLKEWFDKFGNWTQINCDQDRQAMTVTFTEMIKVTMESKITRKNSEEELKMLKNQDAAENDQVLADTEINQEVVDDVADAEQEKVEDAVTKEPEDEQIEDEKDEKDTVSMPWDEQLKDQNMCRRLHYFWSNVEQSYIDQMKSTFELFRHERRRILAYLASTREYFFNYLRRTDGKQSMIDEFQREYNTIHPDMRRDDDTKDELHQRAEELSFQLFEYSMKRKNESIEELDSIKNSVWLNTENQTLLKITIAVIQHEMNRYISTIRVVDDYFALKNGKAINESSMEPLDVLSMIQDAESNTDKNQKTSKKGKSSPKDADDATTTSSVDVLRDQLQNAITVSLAYIASNGPNSSTEDDNSGDDQSNDPWYALHGEVVKMEYQRLEMRLNRLQSILSVFVEDLSVRHEGLCQKLDQWIGLRVNSENEAIESLIQHIQNSVEQETELNHRLVLKGENFLIDQDVIVCPMPNPIQKQSNNHQFKTKAAFTMPQLLKLVEIFRTQNSGGIMEYKSMVQMLLKFSKSNYAQSEPVLPMLWNNINETQLLVLLAPVIVPYASMQYVNWRLLVCSLMLQTLNVIQETVTIPSLDTLFELKQALNSKDTANTGTLNEKKFMSVSMWFDESANNVWQQLLFDLFGTEDTETSEKLVDYNAMLFHLCFNDQSHFGVEKVVSIGQNLNIVQDSTIVQMKDLDTFVGRGTVDVDLGHDINVLYREDLNMQQIKSQKQIVESFNFIDVGQALSL